MVKFLNDDDRLRPGCVAAFGAILRANPLVRLATSRRQPIDAAGAALPDVAATMPITKVSAIMSGREPGGLPLAHPINPVGEATTPVVPRADPVHRDARSVPLGGAGYT